MVIADFPNDQFHHTIIEAYPSVLDAESMRNTFSAVNEKGKTQVTDSGTFAEPLATLNDVLGSSAWLKTLGEITEIDDLMDDEWSGKLELWDDKVKERCHAFSPVSNRCALFRTSDRSYQGVERIHFLQGFAGRPVRSETRAAVQIGHDSSEWSAQFAIERGKLA